MEKYRAYELLHARWAMLAAAGIILPEGLQVSLSLGKTENMNSFLTFSFALANLSQTLFFWLVFASARSQQLVIVIKGT